MSLTKEEKLILEDLKKLLLLKHLSLEEIKEMLKFYANEL